MESMDAIEYRCPRHGTVVLRNVVNARSTEDLQTCPVEERSGRVCGIILTVEFAHHRADTGVAS